MTKSVAAAVCPGATATLPGAPCESAWLASGKSSFERCARAWRRAAVRRRRRRIAPPIKARSRNGHFESRGTSPLNDAQRALQWTWPKSIWSSGRGNLHIAGSSPPDSVTRAMHSLRTLSKGSGGPDEGAGGAADRLDGRADEGGDAFGGRSGTASCGTVTGGAESTEAGLKVRASRCRVVGSDGMRLRSSHGSAANVLCTRLGHTTPIPESSSGLAPVAEEDSCDVVGDRIETGCGGRAFDTHPPHRQTTTNATGTPRLRPTEEVYRTGHVRRTGPARATQRQPP
jgi:hypothetical protein